MSINLTGNHRRFVLRMGAVSLKSRQCDRIVNATLNTLSSEMLTQSIPIVHHANKQMINVSDVTSDPRQ